MTWHKDRGPGERRGYHHGNLREALVEAALTLIREKGPAGFTFAEADRDALIADVARRGFEAFAATLAAAWNEGRPTAREAFNRVGAAYLAFAGKEPAYFAAMFESGLSLADHPDVRAEGDRAFAILREACEAVIATLPADRRPPPLMMALHIWSLSHGTAALFARGDSSRRPIPMSPEELLEAAVLIYLDGLGGR
jgi:AcrR family transcriptional regulator